jgi:hypothetical protein
MRIFTSLLSLYVLLSCTACEKLAYQGYQGQGKKPIYLPLADLGQIKNLGPQPIGETGTIYLTDSLFFLMEYKKGIHVFEVSDSIVSTTAITFLQIPAITDFSVTSNRIYADSWRDLVTIDISNLLQIKEVGRAKDAFTPILFPPLYNGIFECVDETNGALIGWEDALLENVQCQTF